ncbi:MAG: flippase-like domain-containing protein [Bacteroidales bacterium]|nr:flippase-like domain-containing protein [Bacteroidales bacterium]
MDKKVKNILTYIFWGAVAVLLVWLCLRSVDWGQFMEAMRTCRWEYVILSMVLGALVFWLRGCRWRMLLLPIDPRTSRITCFNSYNICMAVNLFLPRAGEVVKLGYVVKNSSRDSSGARLMTFEKSLGTLLIERVWDAVTAVVLAAVVLVLMWKELGEGLFSGFGGLFSNVWLWVGVGALLLLIAVFVLASRLLRERGGIWGKVWGFIRGLGEGLSSFSHMKNAWAFILYTVLIWLFYWIMSCCIVWALEDIPAFSALDIWDAFVIAVVGSISSVVPVPGGFGAYHGVVAGILLSVWNIPIGTGMIFATLAHESQALAQAVCGLASYIHESFFRRS